MRQSRLSLVAVAVVPTGLDWPSGLDRSPVKARFLRTVRAVLLSDLEGPQKGERPVPSTRDGQNVFGRRSGKRAQGRGAAGAGGGPCMRGRSSSKRMVACGRECSEKLFRGLFTYDELACGDSKVNSLTGGPYAPAELGLSGLTKLDRFKPFTCMPHPSPRSPGCRDCGLCDGNLPLDGAKPARGHGSRGDQAAALLVRSCALVLTSTPLASVICPVQCRRQDSEKHIVVKPLIHGLISTIS